MGSLKCVKAISDKIRTSAHHCQKMIIFLCQTKWGQARTARGRMCPALFYDAVLLTGEFVTIKPNPLSKRIIGLISTKYRNTKHGVKSTGLRVLHAMESVQVAGSFFSSQNKMQVKR